MWHSPMKNISCWIEPTAATTTSDHRLRRCVHGVLVATGKQKKIIDDISSVWLSIQRMIAVRQEHLLEPQRPPSTPASLLAARLELQRLSPPGRSDTNVDEEVCQLLCRSPSPQLPQPADRHRLKRALKRDIALVGDQGVSARWSEQETERRLQRHRKDFKRPCLDFDKMQASRSLYRKCWL